MMFFLKEFMKIIQIDADYFTSWGPSFFLFLHLTAFVCSNSPRTRSLRSWVCPVRHPFGGYQYSTFTSVASGFDILSIIITSLSLLRSVCVCVCVCVRVSGSTPFRLSLLHFHYGACPVRHPFEYHYFTFTAVCVRFNTLSSIIISLLLRCVSGSTPFRVSLFHFYYGVCPVRHPFKYHYFTFTTVCVWFDTLSSIIISLLLRCVSGSTPFRVSLFHFYYGVCPVRHPFNYHYFTFTRVCVRFDTLSIVIISLLLSCLPGSTSIRLSLFHFYYGVRPV
jgi:hypothetical protein